MSDRIFWPGGVPDDPLKDSVQWRYQENGDWFSANSGAELATPKFAGVIHEITAEYPMSDAQFNGLFLPWWERSTGGGCAQGVFPFFMRHPVRYGSYLRPVLRWRRQSNQQMSMRLDGLDWIVTLPLRSLPS